MDRRRARWGGVGGLLAVLALVALGCETAVEPFRPSDLHYAVSGYLDAGADTQFVRVRPLLGPLQQPPAPLDARVALTDLATGTTVVMRDSLFRFPEGYVHNSWSTAPVAHGAAYRLTVTGPEGAASAVTVTLPDTFPPPRLALHTSPLSNPETWPYVIYVPGAERLADVRITFRVQNPEVPGDVTYHTLSFVDRVAKSNGELFVTFNPYDAFFKGTFARTCPLVTAAEVVVAAAGPDWPEPAELDEETLALPDQVRNVEGGVGFLGGVSSKTATDPMLVAHLAGLRRLCAECVAGTAPSWRCNGF